MAAKDRFHAAVRIAQELEQWKITDDPLRLEVGGTKFEIDLGAEQLLAAERELEKIAVEIKTFLSDSPLTDYPVVLNLSPEEQKLFLEKLNNQHLTLRTSKPQTSEERLLLWQEWIDTAPKSYANLSDEVLRRENIYDDEV
ncbi:MAG: element excision factor XisH family protein [Rhizonema sp. NSF051]|nr:element excision factor XisH family protein [Rhizonema sp. NSF051]